MGRILQPDVDFDLQLFSSGAGLNYVNKQLGPVCSPVSGGGTIDSGATAQEARHFSKWVFQLIDPTGDPTTTLVGWSVAFYGTIDPRACNRLTLPVGSTAPLSSWIQIEAPSPAGSTPAWYNPITQFGQALFSPTPWVAIRWLATCTSAATGAFQVQVESVP